jgi:hypothetical protein
MSKRELRYPVGAEVDPNKVSHIEEWGAADRDGKVSPARGEEDRGEVIFFLYFLSINCRGGCHTIRWLCKHFEIGDSKSCVCRLDSGYLEKPEHSPHPFFMFPV